jgi:hypothetical protein
MSIMTERCGKEMSQFTAEAFTGELAQNLHKRSKDENGRAEEHAALWSTTAYQMRYTGQRAAMWQELRIISKKKYLKVKQKPGSAIPLQVYRLPS